MNAPTAVQTTEQPIAVSCQCGQRFQAPPQMAGKHAKCPSCGSVLSIPSASSVQESQVNLGAQQTDPLAAASANTLLGSPAPDVGQTASINVPAQQAMANPSWAQPAKRRTSFNPKLLIYLAGGALGVVVLIIAIAVGVKYLTPAIQEAVAVANAEPAMIVIDGVAGDAYPRFPGGFANVRGINDAPFDVDEYFRAPSPDENAAPLYLQALLEFDDGMIKCFPPNANQRAGVLEERRTQITQQFDRWAQSGQEDTQSIENITQQVSEGLSLIRQAQQRPACAFQPEIRITASGFFEPAARVVAKAIALQSLLELRSGNVDHAIENLRQESWRKRFTVDLGPSARVNQETKQVLLATIQPCCFTTPFGRRLKICGGFANGRQQFGIP